MTTLAVSDVTKQFPTPSGSIDVLRNVSLDLSSGENMAILGPSGSGKSTLLHIIGTLDRPTAGSVTLGGRDPFTLSEPELATFRNHEIGFIFQDHHLLPQCSVLENVLLPAVAEGRAAPEVIDRAKTLIDHVGLTPRLEHRPAELSGGERQRVAIARALIQNPTLLLADEPTGNLDRKTADSVARLLLDLQQQDQTMLLVVTHSVEIASLLQKKCELDDQGQLAEDQTA